MQHFQQRERGCRVLTTMQRLQVVIQAISSSPYILAIPSLLFAVMVALGVWGTIEGAAGDVAAARVSAQSRLDGVAQTLELTFAQAVFPVRQLADLIKHYPQYDTVMAMWDDWVPNWWSWAPGSHSVVLMMVPQGVISAVYPHTPTNRANLGLDIFSGYYRAPTLVALNTVLPKVSGPFKAEGDPRLYVTVSIPIYFTNVTPDTTWGIPHQPDCPVGLCYKHESKTKWWGTAAITLDVDVMFDPTGSNHILNQFSDSGLSWRLSSPTFGDSSTYNTVYESSSASMGCNNLCKSIPVVNDEWRLCVWKASWQPAYLVPLLVVLVLVALALSAATFTVLLSRHEHRALLHSLLPAKAIQRLQANYHWATKSVTGTMTVLLEAGTPAEMILSVMEDILLGRPPALPKVMAVRHTLQQSLDVYQPLQADLTQRMAETGNMDSEVREALMVQLMGRQVRDEPECDEGLDPGWQDCQKVSMPYQTSHDSHPCRTSGLGAGLALASATNSLAGHRVQATHEVADPGQGAGHAPSHPCLPAALTSCGTLASKSPTASKCPSSQTEDDSLVAILLADSQPGAGLPPATSWPRTSISPLPASLPSAGTMATVSAVQERVLSLSSGQRPSPSRRAIATPHRLSYTGSRLHPFPVLPRLPSLPHMLAHIMARQQPERLPPGSGAALLAEPPSADHLQDSAPNWAGAAGLSQRSMGQHLLEDIMTSTASGVVVPSPRDVGGGAGFARHSANLVTLAPRPLREPPHIGLFHQVESCLSSANSWAFDAFQLTSATAGRPLSVLAYWLLHQSGLAAWAHLDHTKLARWLCRIEDGYCANPYHNRSHAADVVQTMHMLLTRGGLMPGYADHLTQLAAYLAAVCHDYQHIGRTNDWLVETQDELALRYNDRSPMENHHLAGAFSLLKHPDMNFLQAMPKATYDRLRKLMIELVLGTDMKQHFSIVGSFTAMHRSAPATTLHSAVKPSAVSLSPSVTTAEMSQLDQADTASRHSLVEETSRSLSPISDQDKLLSLQMALKCSDLGHLAAPLPVHLAWVSRLEAEFFAQGDAERAQGLTISPLCDRTKQGITKSQVGFFDFVALPLFNNFTARFTAAKPLLHGVTQNYRHWQAEAAVASAAGG